MAHALVFNIERINRKALVAQKRHDLREGGDLSHTNPAQKSLNRVLHGSGDCVKDVDALMESKGVKVRKDNEAPFTRFVIGASPDLFDSPSRARKWVKDTMGFLEEEYGEGLAYAVLHMDEKTPHIHAVVVPLVESKRGLISSHHKHPATKGLNSYERLRRRAAKRLELDYGTPGNRPQTKAVREALATAETILDRVDVEWSAVRSAKEKMDRDKEALALERKQLNKEREEHAARAQALHIQALALGEIQIAKKTRQLASPSFVVVPDDEEPAPEAPQPPYSNTGVRIGTPPLPKRQRVQQDEAR